MQEPRTPIPLATSGMLAEAPLQHCACFWSLSQPGVHRAPFPLEGLGKVGRRRGHLLQRLPLVGVERAARGGQRGLLVRAPELAQRLAHRRAHLRAPRLAHARATAEKERPAWQVRSDWPCEHLANTLRTPCEHLANTLRTLRHMRTTANDMHGLIMRPSCACSQGICLSPCIAAHPRARRAQAGTWDTRRRALPCTSRPGAAALLALNDHRVTSGCVRG